MDKVRGGRGQRRHVNRLANGASRFRASRVFVNERRARDEVHERQRSEDSKRALPNRTGHEIHYPPAGWQLA